VRQVVDERGDDAAEREQRLVDVARLARARVLGARPAHALGAREVDEVQLANFDDVLARFGHFAHVDGEREDAVRARRLRVARRLGGGALGDAAADVAEDFVGGEDWHLLQILHLDARALVVDDLQPLRAARAARAAARARRAHAVAKELALLARLAHGGRARGGVGHERRRLGGEQVVQPLVVNFEEGDLDVRVLGRALQRRKHAPHGARNDARVGAVGARLQRAVLAPHALHRVRLARARLPVRKHGARVAAQHLVHHGRHRRLKQRGLRRRRVVHACGLHADRKNGG